MSPDLVSNYPWQPPVCPEMQKYLENVEVSHEYTPGLHN